MALEAMPLATVEELQARTAADMTPEELREALGAITDLSDDARIYGSPTWLTPASTPQAVRNLVLRATARHMKNYEGYTQSRAGDETLMWSDREDLGSAAFTKKELETLAKYASTNRLHSAPVYVWGQTDAPAREIVDIYVPTYPLGVQFPYRERP